MESGGVVDKRTFDRVKVRAGFSHKAKDVTFLQQKCPFAQWSKNCLRKQTGTELRAAHWHSHAVCCTGTSTPQPLQESSLEADTEFLSYAAFETLEFEAECNP